MERITEKIEKEVNEMKRIFLMVLVAFMLAGFSGKVFAQWGFETTGKSYRKISYSSGKNEGGISYQSETDFSAYGITYARYANSIEIIANNQDDKKKNRTGKLFPYCELGINYIPEFKGEVSKGTGYAVQISVGGKIFCLQNFALNAYAGATYIGMKDKKTKISVTGIEPAYGILFSFQLGGD